MASATPPPTPAPPPVTATATATASTAPPQVAAESNGPVVNLGNQRSLGEAAVPFATYLAAVHRRIHPVFAKELAVVETLLQDKALHGDLTTTLEIVVDKHTGKLVRIGVVKSSGQIAFDVTALSAVDQAQPFGQAPDIIASLDGNVYLHWEFHRDPEDACTPRNAFPFLLR